MSRRDDGVAMVLALLFMLAFSTLGAGVLVLARTETFSSVNYRLMSQARYGAESGIHKAAHHLLYTYALPGSPADPLAAYDLTTSPVSVGGQPVVLSALPGTPGHYPVSATQEAFAAAAHGTLPVDSTTVSYAASATLLSMRPVVPYGGSAATVVQTWRLTAEGRVNGGRSGVVEVSAILERQVVAAHTYAAFATDSGCGALSFSGGVATDSYDSANLSLVNGQPATSQTWGHVGTNGNLTESGSSTVHGTLSTPRTGVGKCKDGAVTALTINGNAQVTEGVIALPQAVSYPLPDTPSPLPPTTSQQVVSTSGCGVLGSAGAVCSGGSGQLTLTPTGSIVELGNLTVTANATLTLHAGRYHVNTLKLTGGSTLTIGSGPVIVNLAGQDDDTPLDFTGGAAINETFDPAVLRIQYAGTGALKLTGGTTTAAIVYAPLASASITGGAHFYGSVLAAQVHVAGGARLHYDRRLSRDFLTVGPQMMSGFSWKVR